MEKKKKKKNAHWFVRSRQQKRLDIYNSITHNASIKQQIQHSSRAKTQTHISLNPLEKQHAQIHRAAILRLWHVRLGRQKRDFAGRDGRHRALVVRLPIRHQSHLTSDHFYFTAFQVVYFVWFYRFGCVCGDCCVDDEKRVR